MSNGRSDVHKSWIWLRKGVRGFAPSFAAAAVDVAPFTFLQFSRSLPPLPPLQCSIEPSASGSDCPPGSPLAIGQSCVMNSDSIFSFTQYRPNLEFCEPHVAIGLRTCSGFEQSGTIEIREAREGGAEKEEEKEKNLHYHRRRRRRYCANVHLTDGRTDGLLVTIRIHLPAFTAGLPPPPAWSSWNK